MITCFEVIEHVKNSRKVINEIYQNLKPGGIIFITTPNRYFLSFARVLSGKKRPSFHIKEYSPGELKAIKQDAGFYKNKSKGFGAWIPDFLVRKLLCVSNYLGKIGLNYGFFCIGIKRV